jgi:hypothetical protein
MADTPAATWSRLKMYNAIVEAEGPRFSDAQTVIARAHASKSFDELILPAARCLTRTGARTGGRLR